MVKWSSIWSSGQEHSKHRFAQEARRLLPANASDLGPSTLDPKEVTKVALRLKYQIEQVIPCELEEWKVTKANSPIITTKVVQCAKEAGGEQFKACVVYCLLVCKRWFKKQALVELWDSDLHDVRAVACEVIAKRIIEGEEDQEFLMQDVLLKRFSVVIHGEQTEPANVIERAVDLHALRVIGSSGYQRGVKYLWRGWIVQDDKNAGNFINYKERDNPNYWVHFNPDRMKTPLYQNILQVVIELLYLGLYTGAVNTPNKDVDLDVVEGILYIMTFAFICDEITKFWKVGRNYFGFWNAFNSCLYILLTVSFVYRMMALGQHTDDDRRKKLNTEGYHWFAFSAPMFWLRLLLNLDYTRFFGAMLVVLKVMMRESVIFFALLVVICIGFLQAFLGLHQSELDGDEPVTAFIIQAMLNSVMQSPEFSGFDSFAPPFGLVLYYIFTFVIMVVLLNILIALFNSAYEDITDNAVDEYMALFAQKTMRFVRAPDENVFIAPFNLIEMFCLVLPFEWWMNKHRYERLNHYVMGVIYSPLLLITATFEVREAHRVRFNRKRGEEDDDTIEEWEQLESEVDFESEGWNKKVASSRPNVETDADVLEIQILRAELKEVKQMIRSMSVEPEGSVAKDQASEPK